MRGQTSFGQWLKQRRKALDLTRDDLAQRIGCAAVTLNKIEANERRPSKQIAELLAQHLNIPADEYFAFVQFARTNAPNASAPWGTPFHPPTNLPAQPTMLIGREEDVAVLRKRIHQHESRLLTLTGPPGIGKTRLALELGEQVLDDFPDGVFFVALAPITDVNFVAPTIANILGLSDVGPQTPLERLKTFLRDKQTLLILDNFEQILAAAPQIAELLTACPVLKLLVTSRAPLRIRHERQFPISPLTIPNFAQLPDVKTVTQYSAIALFIERAQAVKLDFRLTQENAVTVAAICTRLDGLPLAIELISARVKLFAPAALLERLHGKVMLQSDGLLDIEPRHRTLNAAIAWSYQLLREDEQTLFRRLGIFVGGWTLEAAEAVCAQDSSLDILDGLTSLLDKNLIRQDTGLNGEPRFTMLETIREYALEHLVSSGELDTVRQYYIDYFVKLAEDAEAHAFGREQLAWFDRLEVDWDNLQASLTWSQQSETGLRLVGALGWFFTERLHIDAGPQWLERIIIANPDASPLVLAKALISLGAAFGLVGDQQSITLLKRALALGGAANDRWIMAWSLSHLGLHGLDGIQASVTALDESIALFRELNDRMGLCHTLVRRSFIALELQQDYPYTQLLLKEASVIAIEAGDRVTCGWIDYTMGRVFWLHNHDLKQAKIFFERGLSLFHEARFQVGTILRILAAVEQALGNLVVAQRIYREALVSDSKAGGSHPVSLAGLASVARARGQFLRAAILLGTVNESEMLYMAEHYPEIVTFKSDKAFVHDQLGETAFAAAWFKGSEMTPKQVLTYALEDRAEPAEIQPPRVADQTLTDRELEILRLVVDGLNSREVAERLILSVGTIRWYMKLIYSKLNVHSRSEAIDRARQLKLVS